MSYDSLLKQLGEFGPYHVRIFCLLSFFPIVIAFHALSVVFNDVMPEYRCAVPNYNDSFNIQSDHHQKLVNSSIVFDEKEGRYSQCSRYEEGGQSSGNRSIVSCHHWVYEPEVARTSLTAELDLVCDNKGYRIHIKMMSMTGNLIASFFGGYIIDLVGRKKVLIASNLMIGGLGVAFAFFQSLPLVMFGRFVLSALTMISFASVFVIMAEFMASEWRTFAGVGVMLGWTVGMFILDLIEYLIIDWRIAQIVFSIPSFIFISYIWLLPESPRWLLVNNKEAEAEEIIHKMARSNKVTLPASVRTLLISEDDDSSSKATHDKRRVKPWHLFTNRTMLWRILVLGFNWLAVNLAYFGLTLNVGSLIEGDIYVNFALGAFMELIAYILTLVVLGRVGRKTVHCISLLVCGIALLASAGPLIAGSKIRWVDIALYSIGRLTITIAFTTIYIVTTELMPTSVRNFGLGFCSFLGRIGGVVSPYIGDLGLYVPNAFGQTLPFLIFGLCSIVAGLMFLTMPETRNLKLPDTIEESEAQGKSRVPRNSKHDESSMTTSSC